MDNLAADAEIMSIVAPREAENDLRSNSQIYLRFDVVHDLNRRGSEI